MYGRFVHFQLTVEYCSPTMCQYMHREYLPELSYWQYAYVTRHDISRFMEVKRHKEKTVVKVSRCETGHLSHRQLQFLLQCLSQKIYMLIIYYRYTIYIYL
jgi:hypothetical protein